MANKYCLPMCKILDVDVEKFRVPVGYTFYPGDVVKLETLDTGLSNNLEVYSPTPLATASTDRLCIVINQGFEHLSDGRRPAGNPDITTYSYPAGETVTAIRLRTNYPFHISYDCLDNTGSVSPAIGVYLVGQVGDYQLATASSFTTERQVLKIEKLETVKTGGQFGVASINAVIARVIEGY